MPRRPHRKGLPGARAPRAGAPKPRRPAVRRPRARLSIRRIRL